MTAHTAPDHEELARWLEDVLAHCAAADLRVPSAHPVVRALVCPARLRTRARR